MALHDMDADQLRSKLEEAAKYGQQLLVEQMNLQKEMGLMKGKEDSLTQEVFDLTKKLEVANCTIASMQEDAIDRSAFYKGDDPAKEMEKLRLEHEASKAAAEERIRLLESDVDVKDERIRTLETRQSELESRGQDLEAQVRDLQSVEALVRAEEESARGLLDELKAENVSLKTALELKEAESRRLGSQLAEAAEAARESENEKLELHRQVRSCENDAARCKEDVLCLEQLLENERMQQRSGDERGNSLFGELDDQRKKAEEAFATLKTRYSQLEEKQSILKETNKKLNNDVQGLLLLSCGGRAGDQEYADLEKDLKRLKTETREKEEKIWSLREEVKCKDAALEKLQATKADSGTIDDRARSGSGSGKTDNQLVKYYKDCLEKQKGTTATMEQRWKDEIVEKLLVQEENTKLKFASAMSKREAQKQKAENVKLTMKMSELKDSMSSSSECVVVPEPPPPKRPKIVFEKMPEDWKLVDSGSGQNLDKDFVSGKNGASVSKLSLLAEGGVLTPLDGEANQSSSDSIPGISEDVNSGPKVQKINILSEEEGVMKPDECNQQ